MNDVDFPVTNVLAGLEAAQAANLANIKVNMVVKHGTYDHQIRPMARHFQNTGITLRFIEYMGVGATNGWCMDEVLSSVEAVQRLSAALPLVQLAPACPPKASFTCACWPPKVMTCAACCASQVV